MDFRNETVFLVALIVALTVAVAAVMWATWNDAGTVNPNDCLIGDTRGACK